MRYNREVQPWLDDAPTCCAHVRTPTVVVPRLRVRRPKARMSRWHWLWLAPSLLLAPFVGMFVAALIQVIVTGVPSS